MDGDSLQNGQTSVTIRSLDDKSTATVTQAITVEEVTSTESKRTIIDGVTWGYTIINDKIYDIYPVNKTGLPEDLVIPTEIDGKPVKSLNVSAIITWVSESKWLVGSSSKTVLHPDIAIFASATLDLSPGDKTDTFLFTSSP